MDETGGNAAQIAFWNDRAAETWTRYQDRLDRSFAEVTALVLAQAAAQPGESVLDIGCGCGETVLALARQVGQDGRVLGADVSEPMAARARARIAEAGLSQASIVVADAAAHPFPPGQADLLASRFGVMFFDDPGQAFAHLRTALRPGGRLAFACWRPLAQNPWMAVPLGAGKPLLPPMAPTDPLAPGPFAFADADRVRALLSAAGWTDIAIRPEDVALHMAAPGRIDDAIETATHVGPLAGALAEASPELRKTVSEAVGAALLLFDGKEGVRLPGAVWIVSARA